MAIAICTSCKEELEWEEIYIQSIPSTQGQWVVLYRCSHCLCPELKMIDIPEAQAGWEQLWQP